MTDLPVDERDDFKPVCPYCGKELDRLLARKLALPMLSKRLVSSFDLPSRTTIGGGVKSGLPATRERHSQNSGNGESHLFSVGSEPEIGDCPYFGSRLTPPPTWSLPGSRRWGHRRGEGVRRWETRGGKALA